MAKNILPLFISLTISISVFSQNIPLVENGAVWKESHITIAGPFTLHHAICGDTMRNGILYSQLVALQVDSQMQVTSKNYLAGLRQENSLVFALFSGVQDEVLLYDFSLEMGDEISLTLPFSADQVVRKVDSTAVEMLAGKMRKIIYFQNDDPNCPYAPEFWIEGIGSSYGIWVRAFDPCTVFDAGGQLLCYGHESDYLNLTLIECFLPDLNGCDLTSAAADRISETPDITVYPNPASGFVSINYKTETPAENWQISVHNALGEMVVSPLETAVNGWQMDVAHFPQGIYFLRIMNGENRLVGTGKFLKI